MMVSSLLQFRNKALRNFSKNADMLQSRSRSDHESSQSRVHEVKSWVFSSQGSALTGRTGKLVKDLSHLAVCFSQPQPKLIHIELHHGNRKNVASLRTVKTIINNLIIGVTKGFKYKMRYVYAHFPINVNLDKNKETGLWEVEIR